MKRAPAHHTLLATKYVLAVTLGSLFDRQLRTIVQPPVSGAP